MARDADPFTSIMIGEPFDVAEVSLGDVLSGLGSYTAVVNDPPWTLIAPAFPKPARVIVAADMELSELEALGLVTRHYGHLIIEDPTALRHWMKS